MMVVDILVLILGLVVVLVDKVEIQYLADLLNLYKLLPKVAVVGVEEV